MLPDDWADGSLGPRLFKLPGEWNALLDRYSGLTSGTMLSADAFNNTFDVIRQAGAKHALLEREYIDIDYRNEFAHFYAGTFRTTSDRCERIHFFGENNAYLGFVVIRPIIGRPICRTMVAAPPTEAPYVSCYATSGVRPYGASLVARGFPFISQDAQFGVCAHAAVWMVSLYHHLVNRLPRRLMSDIASAAGARQELDRLVPSAGLTAAQMGTALREIGLPVIPYIVGKLPAGEDVEHIACRYLNSRIPVLVITDDHAVVLIGYGRGSNGELFFVRHDDARGPVPACRRLEER